MSRSKEGSIVLHLRMDGTWPNNESDLRSAIEEILSSSEAEQTMEGFGVGFTVQGVETFEEDESPGESTLHRLAALGTQGKLLQRQEMLSVCE